MRTDQKENFLKALLYPTTCIASTLKSWTYFLWPYRHVAYWCNFCILLTDRVNSWKLLPLNLFEGLAWSPTHLLSAIPISPSQGKPSHFQLQKNIIDKTSYCSCKKIEELLKLPPLLSKWNQLDLQNKEDIDAATEEIQLATTYTAHNSHSILHLETPKLLWIMMELWIRILASTHENSQMPTRKA